MYEESSGTSQVKRRSENKPDDKGVKPASQIWKDRLNDTCSNREEAQTHF